MPPDQPTSPIETATAVPRPLGAAEVQFDGFAKDLASRLSGWWTSPASCRDGIEGAVRGMLRPLWDRWQELRLEIRRLSRLNEALEEQNREYHRLTLQAVTERDAAREETLLVKARWTLNRPTPLPDIREKLLLAVEVPFEPSSARPTALEWTTLTETPENYLFALELVVERLKTVIRERVEVVIAQECPLVPVEVPADAGKAAEDLSTKNTKEHEGRRTGNMTKKITVIITIDGLPDQPNHHSLAVALEDKINDVVAVALAETFDDGCEGKDWTTRVQPC